ncbi:hypothetical protein EVAR_66007_1 [Eumeta japonica]|uniref:Helitron helicase-like domain-containing protein n=1 Tax=Eumeta variegata TaxID=151549 RepID=A0A4C1ZUP3_EUMVA|nr:hypothetical protein EVAR_66007_1 [Eumeta japonica]
MNQKQLRADNYNNLMDNLYNNDSEMGQGIGKMINLPSTYVESPRHLMQNYQDSMAIVCHDRAKIQITVAPQESSDQSTLSNEHHDEIKAYIDIRNLNRKLVFLDFPGNSAREFLSPEKPKSSRNQKPYYHTIEELEPEATFSSSSRRKGNHENIMTLADFRSELAETLCKYTPANTRGRPSNSAIREDKPRPKMRKGKPCQVLPPLEIEDSKDDVCEDIPEEIIPEEIPNNENQEQNANDGNSNDKTRKKRDDESLKLTLLTYNPFRKKTAECLPGNVASYQCIVGWRAFLSLIVSIEGLNKKGDLQQKLSEIAVTYDSAIAKVAMQIREAVLWQCIYSFEDLPHHAGLL